MLGLYQLLFQVWFFKCSWKPRKFNSFNVLSAIRIFQAIRRKRALWSNFSDLKRVFCTNLIDLKRDRLSEAKFSNRRIFFSETTAAIRWCRLLFILNLLLLHFLKYVYCVVYQPHWLYNKIIIIWGQGKNGGGGGLVKEKYFGNLVGTLTLIIRQLPRFFPSRF